MGEKTVDVAITAGEFSVLDPQRVHGPERFGNRIGFGDLAKGDFLVRHRYVSPDVTAFWKRAEKRFDRFGWYVFAHIVSGNSVDGEPVPVNHGRARMSDRMSDDACDGPVHDWTSPAERK